MPPPPAAILLLLLASSSLALAGGGGGDKKAAALSPAECAAAGFDPATLPCLRCTQLPKLLPPAAAAAAAPACAKCCDPLLARSDARDEAIIAAAIERRRRAASGSAPPAAPAPRYASAELIVSQAAILNGDARYNGVAELLKEGLEDDSRVKETVVPDGATVVRLFDAAGVEQEKLSLAGWSRDHVVQFLDEFLEKEES